MFKGCGSCVNELQPFVFFYTIFTSIHRHISLFGKLYAHGLSELFFHGSIQCRIMCIPKLLQYSSCIPLFAHEFYGFHFVLNGFQKFPENFGCP